MKALKQFAVSILLMTLFASCQTKTEIKNLLSNADTRKEIMDSISNDHALSKKMMESMMNNMHGKMAMLGDEKMATMMMENHETMMKMMKDNPAMMHGMMSTMMDMCKNDSTMMAGMCKTMMANPQMMDMMQKMKGGNMNMGKMNAMDTTKAVDHKSHH